MTKRWMCIFGLLICFHLTYAAPLEIPSQLVVTHEIALTLDDLPFVGAVNRSASKLRLQNKRFLKILTALEQYHVPAAGFVVPGSVAKGQWALIKQFHDAGNIIGNHTYLHKAMGRQSAQQYIESIEKADKALIPYLSKPKYFRYPFLAEGKTNSEKYTAVRHCLQRLGYVIAPVTVDSKDYRFNAQLHHIPWRVRKRYAKGIERRYVNFIWAQTKRSQRKAEKKVHRPIKEILLLHMNTLNALSLPAIIKMYRQHGYRFVSLTAAMKDPYYKDNISVPLD